MQLVKLKKNQGGGQKVQCPLRTCACNSVWLIKQGRYHLKQTPVTMVPSVLQYVPRWPSWSGVLANCRVIVFMPFYDGIGVYLICKPLGRSLSSN